MPAWVAMVRREARPAATSASQTFWVSRALVNESASVLPLGDQTSRSDQLPTNPRATTPAGSRICRVWRLRSSRTYSSE